VGDGAADLLRAPTNDHAGARQFLFDLFRPDFGDRVADRAGGPCGFGGDSVLSLPNVFSPLALGQIPAKTQTDGHSYDHANENLFHRSVRQFVRRTLDASWNSADRVLWRLHFSRFESRRAGISSTHEIV